MTTTLNTAKASEIADAILIVRQTQRTESVSKDTWKYIEENRLMYISYWPSKSLVITAKGNNFLRQYNS